MIALLPRLRAFGRALTKDQTLADDLVQLSCEKALRNFHGYSQGTRLDAWLFRIMRNTWIDDRRSAHTRLSTEWPEEDIAADPEGNVIEARSDLRNVARAMAKMEPEQREVLMLIGVSGLKYGEAAEALELPIGTVMSRLARARKKLAQLIGRGDETSALS